MADARRRVRRGPRLEAGPLRPIPAPPRNALADLESLSISFVTLSDNLDLSTPTGRLMFNIIGAMAEFERELIRRENQGRYEERQSQGSTDRQATGVRVDASQIARLRDSGASLREIAARLGVSIGTVAARSKRLSQSASVVA